MKTEIMLSVNAGFSLSIAGKCFWTDALHETHMSDFSTLTGDMPERFMTYAPEPDVMLFTHTHADHYSARLVEEAHRRFPKAQIFIPGEALPPAGEDWSVTPVQMPHQDINNDRDNYGFLIECGGKRIFTAGDAEPADPITRAFTDGLEPDLAVLTFAWVMLFGGRSALTAMKPKNAVFMHLPLPDEDPRGYGRVTERMRDRYMPEGKVMAGFLQTEYFDL